MSPEYPPNGKGAPPIIIRDSDPALQRVPANPSDPRGLRSVGPIANSLPPLRSLFPSKGESPATKRRRLVATGVLTATLGVVAIAGIRHATSVHAPKPLFKDIASGHAGLRTTPSGADEHYAAAKPPAFVLDPSLDKISPEAKGAIVDAFTTWDSANLGLPKATFTISSTAGVAAQDGVSRILYQPITVAGFEDALAITVAYADSETGAIQESDVIVNAKYPFAVLPATPDAACKGSYDVQNVVTHEAGHVYGLGEDYSGTAATMFVSSETCEIHKRILSTSDTQTMSALYTTENAAAASTPATSSSSPAAGCGGATVASRGPTRSGAIWGLGAVVGLALLRRLPRRRRA